MTFWSKNSYKAKILTLINIIRQIFTMSYKSHLTFVLTLYDLFWIIYGNYEGWNSKNNYE